MQRSSRLQSTNSTAAPALIAASGVAMKVLEGQRTVSPRTSANSRAARAPPAQLDTPTLARPFHSDQRASKASSFGPSDHCSESSTSVQRSKRRPRSRWSKPIANLLASDRVSSTGATKARQGYQRNRIRFPARLRGGPTREPRRRRASPPAGPYLRQRRP